MCYGTDCVMDLNKFGCDAERSCICNATDCMHAYLQKEAEGCRDEQMLGQWSRSDSSVMGHFWLAQISVRAFLTGGEQLCCLWQFLGSP